MKTKCFSRKIMTQKEGNMGINFDLSQITQLKTTLAKLAPGLIKKNV